MEDLDQINNRLNTAKKFINDALIAADPTDTQLIARLLRGQAEISKACEGLNGQQFTDAATDWSAGIYYRAEAIAAGA